MRSRRIILATVVSASLLTACAVDRPDATSSSRTKNASLDFSAAMRQLSQNAAARLNAFFGLILPTTTTPKPTTTIPSPTTIRPTTTTSTSTTSTSTTSSTSTSTTTTIPAPAGPCTTTRCRIGDTGPNGGLVFITPSTPGNSKGWYFEALRSTFAYNRAFGCGTTPITGTGAAIGDGLMNTVKIIQACGATSIATGIRNLYTSTPSGVGAWFLPSAGELTQIQKNVAMLKGSTPFTYGEFWSSTTSGATSMLAASSDPERPSERSRDAAFDAILIAAFTPDLSPVMVHGTYNIGDRGPANGYVFITPSTPGNTTGKYFEVAPSNWSGTDVGDVSVVNNKQVAWSCPAYQQTSLAGTQTAIGTGQANTKLINDACASYSGPAQYATAEAVKYRGYGRSDWFVPSKDELYRIVIEIDKTAPGMIHRSTTGSYSVACAWTSSEYDANVAWGGNQMRLSSELYNTTKQISTNCVLPVRMFSLDEAIGPK